jgi:hypothetical protein
VNSVAIHMDVQVALLHPDLHSFGYMPRSVLLNLMVGLLLFFLRDLHAAFRNSWTIYMCTSGV